MIHMLVKINRHIVRVVTLEVVVEAIVEVEENHRRQHLSQSQLKKNGMSCLVYNNAFKIIFYHLTDNRLRAPHPPQVTTHTIQTVADNQ